MPNKKKAIQIFAALNPGAKIDGLKVYLDGQVVNVSAYTDPKAAMVRAANIPQGCDGFEWMDEVDVQIMFRPLSGNRVAMFTLTNFDEIKARVGKDTNNSAITWSNIQQIKDKAEVFSESDLAKLI